MFLLLLGAAAVSAVQTVGNVSLVPPPGFSFELGASDHATIKGGDETAWLILTVYKPRKAGSDLAAEFNADWSGLMKTDPPASPSKRRVGSNAALEGSAQGPDAWTDLIDVSAGDSVITI